VIENVIETVILLLPRSNPDMQAQFLSRSSQDKTSLPHAIPVGNVKVDKNTQEEKCVFFYHGTKFC
jgi:hypothetical protein